MRNLGQSTIDNKLRTPSKQQFGEETKNCIQIRSISTLLLQDMRSSQQGRRQGSSDSCR